MLAILLLAGGLGSMQLQPGYRLSSGDTTFETVQTPMGEFGTADLDNINVAIALAVWLMAPIFVIVFIISPSFRQSILRLLPFYITMILILLLVRRMAQNLQERIEIPEQGLQGEEAMLAPATEMPPPPAYINDPPQWLIFTLSLMVLLLFAGLAWFIWRRFAKTPAPDSMELLSLEVQEAVDALKAGGNLRETITRCYAEMTRILAESRGIKRRQGMTPREFETHLAEVGFSDQHIQQLTRLFEDVRYGPREASAEQQQRAINSLSIIAHTYGEST